MEGDLIIEQSKTSGQKQYVLGPFLGKVLVEFRADLQRFFKSLNKKHNDILRLNSSTNKKL